MWFKTVVFAMAISLEVVAIWEQLRRDAISTVLTLDPAPVPGSVLCCLYQHMEQLTNLGCVSSSPGLLLIRRQGGRVRTYHLMNLFLCFTSLQIYSAFKFNILSIHLFKRNKMFEMAFRGQPCTINTLDSHANCMLCQAVLPTIISLSLVSYYQ